MLDSRQKLGMEPPLVTDSVDVSFYRVLPGVTRSMTGAEHLLVMSVNVLARSGCHDHAPQMGGLKQQKFVSSQSWRLKSAIRDGGIGFTSRLSPWLVDGVSFQCLHVCISSS